MDNESFDVKFDNALNEVLALKDEELLKLPDNQTLEMVFTNFESMNEAYLESQITERKGRHPDC